MPPVIICGDLNEDVAEYEQHGALYQTALMPESADVPGFDGGSPSLFVTADLSEAGIRPDPAAYGSPVVEPAASGVTPASRVVLFTPWLASPGGVGFSLPGSYWHGGQWERLDQVLILPGGERAARLTVIDHPDLLDSTGRPRRYDPRTGYGYSDHLPVLVHIEL